MNMHRKHVFWGKFDATNPNRAIHPLEDHSLDVSVVFHRLCESTLMGQMLLAHLEKCSADETIIWVDRFTVLAFLHDLGKCNWGFQSKRFEQARETTGHSIEGASFFGTSSIRSGWPAEWKAFIRDASDWFLEKDQALFELLIASVSHHGKPISSHNIDAVLRPDRWWKRYRLPDGTAINPMDGIAMLSVAARSAFPRAFERDVRPISAPPAFQQRFAGMLMLADWIASDTQFFRYRSGAEENRRVVAESSAERALRTIGLIAPRLAELPTFKDSFSFNPTPLQGAMDAMPMSEAERILLIESETGSGKTEAALRWFWRLQHEGKVEGLYFALPTRVAARELYNRVLRSVQTVFPDANQRPSPVLLAVPGYVKADGERILPRAENAVWDDQSDTMDRVWAGERPKRYLAAPIAVGTVDQAMLSVLKVKHALMRSVCLDRHLLVVDEVHASDTYMRTIISTLIAQHARRGGWALMLSATLGEAARAEFFESECLNLDAAIRRPYPAVTTRNREIPVPATDREKRVEVECMSSDDGRGIVSRVVEGLRKNARILIVCNTVGEAIALQGEVEAAVPESVGLFVCQDVVCPHHGRFARADREALDQAVSARLGKESPPGPVVLIGTQTLEQSLDIDADLLITDLAPMDVLLQRIGRLHRHDRPRPSGFETPRVVIRVPSNPLEEFLIPGGKLQGPSGWGTVYANGLSLQATLNELGRRTHIVIPRDNRELVECITHPDALARLPDAWRAHRGWLEGQFLEDWRVANTSMLEDQPFGELHYDNDGKKMLTRLGPGGVCIRLVPAVTGPFGRPIDEIIVPLRWCPSADNPPESVEAVPLADQPGFRFAIRDEQFIYTRFGLEKASP